MYYTREHSMKTCHVILIYVLFYYIYYYIIFLMAYFLFAYLVKCIFLKDFIYLVLERGEGRQEERERTMDVQEKHWSVASCNPRTGHLAHNPGTCPDWEWNWQPFSLQASTQFTEPHQPGPNIFFI